MKMLCIKGSLPKPPWHDGLKAGVTYDVDLVKHCCETRAFAAGSVFKKPVKLECNKCKAILTPTQIPWGPERFIPFDPPKISEQEANDLYLTIKPRAPALITDDVNGYEVDETLP